MLHGTDQNGGSMDGYGNGGMMGGDGKNGKKFDEICKYYTQPGGCRRGSKCFYKHESVFRFFVYCFYSSHSLIPP